MSNTYKHERLPTPFAPQNATYFDARLRVDLVHGIARCTASFAIEIERLQEHGLITIAAYPHVALVAALEANAFADVQSRATLVDRKLVLSRSVPGFLARFRSMHITQRAETKAVADRGHVGATVDSHFFKCVGHFESLAHLHVTLVVGDAAPVLAEITHQRQRRHRRRARRNDRMLLP